MSENGELQTKVWEVLKEAIRNREMKKEKDQSLLCGSHSRARPAGRGREEGIRRLEPSARSREEERLQQGTAHSKEQGRRQSRLPARKSLQVGTGLDRSTKPPGSRETQHTPVDMGC
ncbi:Hypothetical predicted protein [Marmota monax]|uniref:Uncharacterized protein n=1 Tax=Marmota monax TaxID=9995 RepID=A0A5E4CAN8_MARMO|nr:Hypothetical predicted protein [Marmota monax]